MAANERLALIRARYAAAMGFVRREVRNPEGIFHSRDPKAGCRAVWRLWRETAVARPAPTAHIPFGEASLDLARPAWVHAPDAKPKPTPKPNRRHKGRRALTVIGEQAGVKKLPRVHKYVWQKADAGKASQHEQ